MRLSRSVVRKGVAMIGAAIALMLAFAIPASAATTYSYTFYIGHQSYKVTDSHGTFDGQMSFQATASTLNPMAWSFQVSPALRAISTGNMACIASQTQNGKVTNYHDSHPSVPTKTYVWHSTVPKNPYSYSEILAGSCTFPVEGDGTAVLTFSFHYTASDGGTSAVKGPAANVKSAGEYSSKLSISR